MWVDFSLTHAWLIPLLPALAFVVISFLLLRSPWLASRLAILAMASSFGALLPQLYASGNAPNAPR